MTQSEIVLVFTETAQSWIGRRATEAHAALVAQLNQAGYTAFLNNYTLAFRNLHHPIVLIGRAKFLQAWSLRNPIIVVPNISAAGEIDFLRHDPRVRCVFLAAKQIDFLDDARVRVGNIDHPAFLKKLSNVLDFEQPYVHHSTVRE
jgi:hypothetical protein